MRDAFVLLTLVAVSTAAVGQEVNRDKLRKAAAMPKVNVMTGLGFNSKGGFSVLNEEKPDRQPEIASLRKALQADPADAEKLLRLAGLLFDTDDEKGGESVRAEAARISRNRLSQSPDDSRLLTRLARCLRDDNPETEALLRKAVRVAPGNWDAWISLGDFLNGQVLVALLGEKDGAKVNYQPEVLLT